MKSLEKSKIKINKYGNGENVPDLEIRYSISLL